MESMTALHPKSVCVIEGGVMAKWPLEKVSWFLSRNFGQCSFFLRFSRRRDFIVKLSGESYHPHL